MNCLKIILTERRGLAGAGSSGASQEPGDLWYVIASCGAIDHCKFICKIKAF
jgi:hypothetical protein